MLFLQKSHFLNLFCHCFFIKKYIKFAPIYFKPIKIMKRLNYLLPFVIMFTFGCGGGGSKSDSTESEATEDSIAVEAQKTIAGLAMESGDLSMLASALQKTGLDSTLMGEGPFTVFAPDDNAFGAIDSAVLNDPARLEDILNYHVVSGKMMSSDLSDGMSIETVNTSPIIISMEDSVTVKVNDANVTTPDIEADNGVIHIIDVVLMPPSAGEVTEN